MMPCVCVLDKLANDSLAMMTLTGHLEVCVQNIQRAQAEKDCETLSCTVGNRVI